MSNLANTAIYPLIKTNGLCHKRLCINFFKLIHLSKQKDKIEKENLSVKFTASNGIEVEMVFTNKKCDKIIDNVKNCILNAYSRRIKGNYNHDKFNS